MALFSAHNDPNEEYRIFVTAVEYELAPKDGFLHTYILDIHENSRKSQQYVNLLLQLLQSKGYEIVDVQYQYAISTTTTDGWYTYSSPDKMSIQRERSIMFLYK